MDQLPKLARPPQVDKILRYSSLDTWRETIDAKCLSELVRTVIKEQDGQVHFAELGEEKSIAAIAELVVAKLQDLTKPSLVKLINATGVIINTNLGRSPLSKQIAEGLSTMMQGYCNLEFDLETGTRCDRLSRVEELLKLITRCQSSLVVNNNAAAVFLLVNTLAKDKEVIISRGELIEIGGSFRLPDVILQAGGILKEVGTTNRTRLADYQKAITKDTGLILKCHRSNFQMEGFVEETSLIELVKLSNQKQIPLAEDLGSGALIALEEFGLSKERTVQEALEEGAAIVTFSGDKLLGGGQAGIIAGQTEYLSALKENSVYRTVRADKLLVYVLENVLAQYLSPTNLQSIPVLSMASAPLLSIKQRVEQFIERANRELKSFSLALLPTESTFGGGAAPGQTQKSFAAEIAPKSSAQITSNGLMKALRQATPPVIAHIVNTKVVLDFRTIAGEEEEVLLYAIKSIDARYQ